MIIKTLEVENWKCFLNKRTFKFKKHELIKMKNGTGKTSIFEAILYGIWGKPPVGFNLNTVRNDSNKPCRVYITFDLNIQGEGLKEATIERIFGSNSPLYELRIDGTLVCESVRTIESYMDNIINQKITTQLWTSSLIESDITSSNFFTKSILDDILKDPLSLVSIYKSKIYANNKRINSFKETVLDINALEKELIEIKAKLKEKSDGNITLAKASENAAIQVAELEKKIEGFEMSLENARLYSRLYNQKDLIEASLDEEEKKRVSIFSNFNSREIEKIIKASENSGSCLLCGGKFDVTRVQHLREELSLTGRSEEKISKLKEQLKLLEADKTKVEALLELESQKSIVRKCPNFKEIIEGYNEENNKLWKEFEKIQKNYALALKQQEELKELNALKVEVESYREKLAVLNEYIKNASVHYTNEIMGKASQYLSSINSRYKQIYLYEEGFYVVVEDENFALNLLPITRLSNGEKTMCALSLLFAVHNVIVPELPLLFDETFSALDIENLEQVQNFLRKQDDTQIFIITHEKSWNEF